MTVVDDTRLTLAHAAAILERAVKDKSYRATPIGLLVGRYIRWARNERGFSPATIRSYEGQLARMAVTLAHMEPEAVTREDLRLVIDLWADRDPQTRANVTSAIRSFWKWAEDEGHVVLSPASKIRRPKVPQRQVDLLPTLTDTMLLDVAENPRDRLGLIILLDYGLRRGELHGVRVRDLDLGRRTLTVVKAKGGKVRVLPIRGRIVQAADEYLLTELPAPVRRPPEPDDFVIYSEQRNRYGVHRASPKDPMPVQTLHRWWYRHLQAAGLVGKGVERGLNMHRARHTFATELRRDSRDLGVVQRMLGHADSSTTERTYGHYDLSDLEAAMERFAKGRE